MTSGAAPVADRHRFGVLDTCVYLDLANLDPTQLPVEPTITVITMAELSQGVAMARDAVSRAARTEQLGAAIAAFDPWPFDSDAAARYGTLVALTLKAKRNSRPRRMDLLIAAIASVRCLPLFTRNVADFEGMHEVVEIVAV
jgi:predicted nucleic acid-binding protein